MHLLTERNPVIFLIPWYVGCFVNDEFQMLDHFFLSKQDYLQAPCLSSSEKCHSKGYFIFLFSTKHLNQEGNEGTDR